MSDKGANNLAGQGLSEAKRAGDAAKRVAATAGDAGADALEQAKGVVSDARERVTTLAGDAKEAALSHAETQKSNLADRVDQLANSVQRTGEALEGEQDWIAKLVERGAHELGTLADTLRTNDLKSLAGNLDGLARRQPALFLGASVIAGFALARVGRVAVAGAQSAGPSYEPEPNKVVTLPGGMPAIDHATDVGAVPPSMPSPVTKPAVGPTSSAGNSGLATGTSASPVSAPVIKSGPTP